MNAIIRGKPDNLDEIGQRFDRARLTRPVFLNSVPKAGTHLIRNILRMFVAPEQHWPRRSLAMTWPSFRSNTARSTRDRS